MGARSSIARSGRWIGALLIAAALSDATTSGRSDLSTAFERFWSAKSPSDAAKAIPEILKSGASFDEVLARLKAGRTFERSVPTGVVAGRRGEFEYSLDVPAAYDPSRTYQVRVQLHGGVMRDEPGVRGRGAGRLAGAEQLYLSPAGWSQAPWWSNAQLENLRALLDLVKRTYNVDENRVVLSGVSDGGTGAYYIAMRDTTPYAAFLPLNGYMLVLHNERLQIDGELFPGNLINKPLFVVNGGRDPLYPTAAVVPVLQHLAKRGVDITYRPQPDAGHDTSWWPAVRDDYETFVRTHPRQPYPDRLTWETADPKLTGRAHWLTIDALGSTPGDASDLTDVNSDYSPAATADLGFRLDGMKVEQLTRGSMADRLGLQNGDVIQRVGDVHVTSPQSFAQVLQTYAVHAPIRLTVARGGGTRELAGTFDPDEIRQPGGPMFARHGKSGRVDLEKRGNTVTARTRGVTTFTLLISADHFDLAAPVTVIVNGRPLFNGPVQRNPETLLKWAARDNDRTMLFAAELTIRLRD